MPPISVHIAAGGHGTRLREHMTELGYADTFPKHLLPTGGTDKETFLGRVVRQVSVVPNALPPVVWVNESNLEHIRLHPDIPSYAQITPGNHANFFVPMIEDLATNSKRVIGCAGDFYAEVDWGDLLTFHESTPYPVTFVAGNTIPVEKGLVYTVEADGKVAGFERSDKTEGHEMINVGVYVFDPDERIVNALQSVLQGKEEHIAQALVDHGLLGLYILPTMPFNVNTPETYRALLEHHSSIPR